LVFHFQGRDFSWPLCFFHRLRRCGHPFYRKTNKWAKRGNVLLTCGTMAALLGRTSARRSRIHNWMSTYETRIIKKLTDKGNRSRKPERPVWDTVVPVWKLRNII
jgi:hypothetical protein